MLFFFFALYNCIYVICIYIFHSKNKHLISIIILIKMDKKRYTSPSVEVIEVEVETGFATSNGDLDNESWS